MARKQSDYLSSLLADDPVDPGNAAGPGEQVSVEQLTASLQRVVDKAEAGHFASGHVPSGRARGTTLLGRESALARVASGEVRQVTQLLLDPARVRVWPGNARSYDRLNADNCRELIDSLLAEGGQKVPAVVRRIDGDPDHDYEVIAGTRRHWSISWLRRHDYPDMQFLAQVAQLDDEAAFRLADLENRARADVSDLERARNYLAALATHYDDHQSRMADRLKVSKSWLSKMLKVATLPDPVVAAFASPTEISLRSGYALAHALDDPDSAGAIMAVARDIRMRQTSRRDDGLPPLPAADVLRQLLDAPRSANGAEKPQLFTQVNPLGRPILSLQSINRQGATVRLHAGSGTDRAMLIEAMHELLDHLDASGQGLR
jgi:ParB family chromosome partitioning protein